MYSIGLHAGTAATLIGTFKVSTKLKPEHGNLHKFVSIHFSETGLREAQFLSTFKSALAPQSIECKRLNKPNFWYPIGERIQLTFVN